MQFEKKNLLNEQKCLVVLAQEGNLPLHQYMDEETLQWIIGNNPGFEIPKIVDSKMGYIKETVKNLIPDKEWFLENKIIDSIHGIRHVMRETANMANLVYSKDYSDEYFNDIFLACVLHDIQRKDDKGDLGHAVRAAEWFQQNADKVTRYFKIDPQKINVDRICTAIKLHEIPYDQIQNSQEYLDNKEIVDLVKTADALDRYRLPKLRWWFNPEYVQFIPDKESMAFAYWLVVKSETEFLASQNSVDSIVKGLEQVSIK